MKGDGEMEMWLGEGDEEEIKLSRGLADGRCGWRRY